MKPMSWKIDIWLGGIFFFYFMATLTGNFNQNSKSSPSHLQDRKLVQGCELPPFHWIKPPSKLPHTKLSHLDLEEEKSKPKTVLFVLYVWFMYFIFVLSFLLFPILLYHPSLYFQTLYVSHDTHFLISILKSYFSFPLMPSLIYILLPSTIRIALSLICFSSFAHPQSFFITYIFSMYLDC
jgi:hypothetical protein